MTRFSIFAALTLAAACGNADAAPEATGGTLAATATEQGLPTVLVYKTATCGCCAGWVEHMRQAGFTVDARDLPNNTELMRVKVDAGVPGAMTTCHTALVDGYVVEGHVPPDQIKRLLAERPEVAGIAVPGMPIGSPGMEGPGAQPYQVFSFDRQGGSAVFAEVDPR
ncbi:MAG TPA: DUF411 domain-containing protein [Longimicrobiales bacterium]|nr:DUF411 domain-containing protein [Longimicrobiales bacterium]